MKKKKLSGLNLNKKAISKLQGQSIKGGTHFTFQTGCNSQQCEYSGNTCNVSLCACE